MKKIILYFGSVLLLTACSNSEKAVHPVKKDITETVFASGAIDLNNRYNLIVQSDGYITDLMFTEGDNVTGGQLLAIIDNTTATAGNAAASQQLSIAAYNTGPDAPALKQAEANIQFAKEKQAQDELQAERMRKLLASNSIARIEYENAKLQAESSKTNVKVLEEQYALLKQQARSNYINQQAQQSINAGNYNFNKVKAPVGGKILKRLKQAGDYIRRGEVIAVIGNPGTLIARTNIDESSIAKIHPGMKALIRLNTEKDKVYNGTVTEILPMFDEQTQSYICKISFDSIPAAIIVGTQLEANIITGEKKDALLIPRSYLNFGNKVNVKGKDSAVQVTTGIVSTEWVEILAGLSITDEILPIKP